MYICWTAVCSIRPRLALGPNRLRVVKVPLLSECATRNTVKAALWPWLFRKSHWTLSTCSGTRKTVKAGFWPQLWGASRWALSSCSLFDWKRVRGSVVMVPSKRGTAWKVLRTFAWKPRPESGRDCLICAMFARKRIVIRFVKVVSLVLAVLNRYSQCHFIQRNHLPVLENQLPHKIVNLSFTITG